MLKLCVYLLFTGQDFELPAVTSLTFRPEDAKLPVPLKVLSDSIPEEVEQFRMYLSINESKNGLGISRGSTSISIIDNDSEISSTV